MTDPTFHGGGVVHSAATVVLACRVAVVDPEAWPKSGWIWGNSSICTGIFLISTHSSTGVTPAFH